MFDWIKRVFFPDRERVSNISRAAPDEHVWSEADAPAIENMLRALQTIGLRPTPNVVGRLAETALEIARKSSGGISYGKFDAGSYALLALNLPDSLPEDGLFENAILVPEFDENIDIISHYEETIKRLVALTGGKWVVENVDVSTVDGKPPKLVEPLNIQLRTSPQVTPFTVTQLEILDDILIERLNERLPAVVTERFAFFPDPDVIVVFLEPAQIVQLNEYCGGQFFSTSAKSALEGYSQ